MEKMATLHYMDIGSLMKNAMIDTLYDLLAKIGYTHPLHPPFTHGPIGALIVAFAWAWPAESCADTFCCYPPITLS
ncbi:MAG: hypothetical protein M8364_02735 [Methylobacter sp.]|uniref:hypothetical protein n=1 Tax=Methylobacter sp. TaxID=2051955 RepID=UPI0025905E97|nr:hypothetical protein [Methylobacter sp.]MCL7419807.1 hypothetical protein [Methylobacter sp.]